MINMQRILRSIVSRTWIIILLIMFIHNEVMYVRCASLSKTEADAAENNQNLENQLKQQSGEDKSSEPSLAGQVPSVAETDKSAGLPVEDALTPDRDDQQLALIAVAAGVDGNHALKENRKTKKEEEQEEEKEEEEEEEEERNVESNADQLTARNSAQPELHFDDNEEDNASNLEEKEFDEHHDESENNEEIENYEAMHPTGEETKEEVERSWRKESNLENDDRKDGDDDKTVEEMEEDEEKEKEKLEAEEQSSKEDGIGMSDFYEVENDEDRTNENKFLLNRNKKTFQRKSRMREDNINNYSNIM